MALEPGPAHIIKGFHQTKAEVLADIAAQDMWPSIYVSERMDELPLHWHEGDVCGYVLEGSSYIINEKGEHMPLAAGDKLVLPAGAVHAEGKVEARMVYIVATAEASNLMDALKIHSPEQ
ncbi:MAG: cupin domain-containing protein [Proteobacteria bacterium]|nr:cupin domain-containing protein [Pseudomonadota bacterium]